jgi:hypothetical protein
MRELNTHLPCELVQQMGRPARTGAFEARAGINAQCDGVYVAGGRLRDDSDLVRQGGYLRFDA